MRGGAAGFWAGAPHGLRATIIKAMSESAVNRMAVVSGDIHSFMYEIGVRTIHEYLPSSGSWVVSARQGESEATAGKARPSKARECEARPSHARLGHGRQGKARHSEQNDVDHAPPVALNAR